MTPEPSVERTPTSRPVDGERRRFLLSSARVGTLLGAGALAGCTRDPSHDRQLQFTSLAMAADELARLAQARTLVSGAAFSWPQTLVHCAQSIEYSMSGFPASKSALFQHTIGAAAIGVFSWRGRMTHDLAEPIPGAPPLGAEIEPARAVERLGAALQRFARWQEPLRPHFAYGELTRHEYELAHAMHLANHLSAFRIAS
jgi:hypothetical protein